MKYLCDPHIIPTVVPQDLDAIAAAAVQHSAYARWLHMDIADGRFAPNITWPFQNPYQIEELETRDLKAIIPASISLEAHLMIETPAELGSKLAKIGVNRVIAHIEAFPDGDHAREAIHVWRAGAIEVGLAIQIETPLSALESVASECDVIHVMSISEIGKQGYAFDERALSRVEELHAKYPDMMVAVDGGVSESTVEELVRAGANRLMVGHVLAESGKPEVTYANILARAMQGCAPLASEVTV